MWRANARSITYEGLWWKPRPRAGPSPPPTDRPVFVPLPGRPREWCARNEEFTGAPSCVVAWRRSFEGISQAGRRPNHGCRISADGTEPSAREALCTSPTVRSRHGRRGGGPVHGPRQCRAALDRPDHGPGPASTPSLPDLSEGVRPSVVTSTKRHKPDRRTYVLDTSVLLADPNALNRFDEHEVVLPIVVVTELEAKRHHPELGYFARQALRLLDEFRVRHGRLDAPIPIGDLGGTAPGRAQPLGPQRAALRLPPGRQRLPHPRGRPQPAGGGIRRHRRLEGPAAAGSRRPPSACSPRSTAPSWRSDASGWTGMAELDACRASRWTCSSRRAGSSVAEAADLPVHTGLALQSERGKALGRVTPGRERAAGARRPGGVRHPRPQRRAADRARPAARPGDRDRVDGRPGRHRQVGAARCAPAWRPVLERRQHQKVMVFRPLYAVGGQELGYLPGSEAEKMSPWAQAVFDTLSARHQPGGHRGGDWRAGCWRCCRSPTSGAARCTTRS